MKCYEEKVKSLSKLSLGNKEHVKFLHFNLMGIYIAALKSPAAIHRVNARLKPIVIRDLLSHLQQVRTAGHNHQSATAYHFDLKKIVVTVLI